MKLPEQIIKMRDAGALFAVNHSGGKDSQAMFLKLKELGVPDLQIVIFHACLGEVEWPGTIEHIKATTGGARLIIAKATKTLFEMVRHRGMWPSAAQRQCTSDLKRGPIEREIRRYLKDYNRYGGLVVNCMGMRAQESSARAKREPLKFSARNSRAGRTWFDWLPIHDMDEVEVFETIHRHRQAPHWAYSKGMSRLSCSFCIMASKCDLRIAAQLRPDLYRKHVELEKEIGHTMNMAGVSLEEVTGVPA